MPFIVGIAAFFIVALTVSIISGPSKCNDGWASSSVGRQGACSSHGGVDRSKASLALTLGFIAGIAGFVGTRRIQGMSAGGVLSAIANAKRIARERSEIKPALCPDCGATMLQTRQQPRDGRPGWFLICSRFPECRGFTDLPQGEQFRGG